MVFTTPSWVPALPADTPSSITVGTFMTSEAYGCPSAATSRNPYTCGVTGKTHTSSQVSRRIDYLARSLAERLDFSPNKGTEWEKVVALYSLNTIDYIPVTHAVHRLSGIVTPVSAAYLAPELEYQLRSSGAKALITCVPLLDHALKAARAVDIPENRIFILEVPGACKPVPFATVEELIQQGETLPGLEPLRWTMNQGARQVAYLCYSSGTSGFPKGVMVSHQNVIANIMQLATFESVSRKRLNIKSQITMGLLPFSHIYGLIAVAHYSTYMGDEVIVLPKFELQLFLATIQKYKIAQLPLVPPILIQMIQNADLCSKYRLSSVRYLYTGAAPLGPETVSTLSRLYPQWRIGQGYGLTETTSAVSFTSELDIDIGSSGSLVPGTRVKIIDVDGKEITKYNEPGELFIQGPSVVLGYLDNEVANAETFVWDEDGRWLKTGDVVIMRRASSGYEHLVIVDRIKELIKVKGHQVAPAELEAHLLTHPAIADCAVIPCEHAALGEIPKAYVVKSDSVVGTTDQDIANDIRKHVEQHKAPYKWLKGGIEFVDVIPKSPSGKILRRLLRDRERKAKKALAVKI